MYNYTNHGEYIHCPKNPRLYIIRKDLSEKGPISTIHKSILKPQQWKQICDNMILW